MTTVVTPIHGFHLGKLDPVPSLFRAFKEYFDGALAAPPSSAHWGKYVTVPFQMDANGPDPQVTIAPAGWGGCGDCVEAHKAHALMVGDYIPGDANSVPTPTADAVVEQYCVYQKCTPDQLFSDPNTWDQGEDMTTSLTTWCTTEEYGTKLGFTMPIDPSNQDDLKNGIDLNGCIGIGVQIQEAQEEQFPNEWKWVKGSQILGGHAVLLTGYTEDYVSVVTWGQLIRATWGWVKEAIDEAHALGLPQIVAAGKSPTGLNIAQWQYDLAELNAA